MIMEIGDATYYYEIRGEGPPVLLLHGFTGTSATWSQLVKELEDQFQFILLDLPGHGQTTMKTPRTMEMCCQDLAQLIKKLHLPKVHLLGYSMGGRTALSFAMLYPNLVQSLILESASPGLASEIERMKRVKHDEDLARRLEQNGLEAFVDDWENIPLFATQKSLPLIVQEQIRRERLSQTIEGLSASLKYMGTGAQPHWWDDLHRLTCSVLLIAGQEDQKFVQLNQRMKDLFQKARLEIVSGAGHAVHLEKPEVFTQLVATFLESDLSTSPI